MMGMGVVMAGGDGLVVVIEVWGRGLIIDSDGSLQGLGIGVGFERTTKMKSENGSENVHFC